MDRKSLVKKETVESRLAHVHPDWDPEWIEYVFTAWLKCNRDPCSQPVAVSGKGFVREQFDPENENSWLDYYFSPVWCTPMPDMFELSHKWPKHIKNELRAAFALFWCNPAASATKIRISLECLLDHLKVKKRRKKEGKFIKLNLHQRIEAFQKNEPSIGSQLMALKWLGNTSSHEGEVSHFDVLDGFEIIEHTLVELLDKRTAKVAALARGLTEKHQRRRK